MNVNGKTLEKVGQKDSFLPSCRFQAYVFVLTILYYIDQLNYGSQGAGVEKWCCCLWQSH